jgi:hypothetical protein
MDMVNPVLHFISHLNLIALLLLIWVSYGVVVLVRKLKRTKPIYFDRLALVVTASACVAAVFLLMFTSSRFATPQTAHTFAVTGQLLAGSVSGRGDHAIAGASVYFLPSQVGSRADFWKAFVGTEPEAISHDTSLSTVDRCSDEFNSLIKENTGQAGPLDAKFYPIMKMWSAMKKHPEFLKLNAETQQGVTQSYWKTKVAGDPEFANLSPDELGRYRSIMLLGDDWDGKLRETIQTLPYVISDSRGEFTARLPTGKYLLIALGTDSASGQPYLWAVPFTVEGDSRIVTDDVVCGAP